MSSLLVTRHSDAPVALTGLKAGEKAERQRKGWNFLTWAFFLPQLAAAETLFGSSAKAATVEDAQGKPLPSTDVVGNTSDLASQAAVNARSSETPPDGDALQGKSATAPVAGNVMSGEGQQAPAALGVGNAGKGDTEVVASGGGGGGGGRAQTTSSSVHASDVAESDPSDAAPDPLGVAVAGAAQTDPVIPVKDDTSSSGGSVSASNDPGRGGVADQSDPASHALPANDGVGPVLTDGGGSVEPPAGGVDIPPGGGVVVVPPGGGIVVDIPGGGVVVGPPGGGIVVDLPGGGVVVDLPGGGISVDLPGVDVVVDLPGGGISVGLPVADIAVDLPAGDIAVSVKSLLGFEINLNGDGLTADLSVGPFGDLLGFDAQLSADGVLAGVELDLGSVASTAEAVLTGVASVVENTGAELTGMLALDSHFGTVLAGELLGSDAGAVTQPVRATLGELTGVDLFTSVDDGLANTLTDHLSIAGEVAPAIIAEAISVADVSDVLAITHVLADVSDISKLADNGDISSGDVINFPEAALTLVDELFTGPKYTDYNVTLQTHKTEVMEQQPESITASVPLDIVETVVAIADPVPPTSDPTPDSLLHTSLSVLHLAI